MKQKEIIFFIKRSFKKIGKYFTQIIIDFEIEAIHKFRTEIKKLRAFLRLLNVHSEKELKIPKEIKNFYSCAGNIRNLQLQIKNINDYPESSGNPLAIACLKYLNAEIQLYKEDPTIYIKEEIFGKEAKKLIAHLPGNFKSRSIKIFILKKLNELQQLLLQLDNDEALHNLRKILKDILYNWVLIKHYRRLLPSAIAEKKNIESLAEILGDYCDKKTGVELLQTYCSGLFQCEENMLQRIIEKWQEEKLHLKQQIYYYLRLIQFT
ncbi:MAG: hypothetical protein JWO92_1453 [Chitinophagaceae bacterium]|nr:hypothetical protein [Chitinophagaceae bacterium]